MVQILLVGLRLFIKMYKAALLTMASPLITSLLSEELGKEIHYPLSPYLFVVAVKILAIAIRQNSTIKGITIGKKETKLLQYADDTTVVFSDINSAQTLFKLIDDFKKLSGLEVNPTKTEGMWIGSSREIKTNPLVLNGQ